MFVLYVAVTVLTVAFNVFSAVCDFVRYEQVTIAMRRAGVSTSWMATLGILKATAALGLLIGFRVPLIGTAAAVGLIMFFVGAIIVHLRAHDYTFGLAVVFLLLAVATLALQFYQGSKIVRTRGLGRKK